MPPIRALLSRLVGLTVLWWALGEGRVHEPLQGAFAVGAAGAVSLWLVPPGRWGWRWSALPGFVPFFLRESWLGGIDVARRAFHPRLPLRPGLLRYRVSLTREDARVFFTYVVSLLPGTLSVQLDGDVLVVHALDERLPVRERLSELERQVVRLFPAAHSASG